MPKKKTRGHPAHRGETSRSPLRVGGKLLGDLQVPFRRFLDAELEQDEDPALTAGDLEARLMESLGWMALTFEYDLSTGARASRDRESARWFPAPHLTELLTEVVPAVAEHNGLDPQELVDETRVAWTTYLMFLGESEAWLGEPEELADCLDVASGGVGGTASSQATVLDALAAAELAVPSATRLEDLASLPVVAAALAAVDDLAAGLQAGDGAPDEGPAVEALRSRLAPFEPALDPVTEWMGLRENGYVVVRNGLTHVPKAGDTDHRVDLATWFLASAISSTLAACPSPTGIVGALSVVASAVLDPMTTGRLREQLAETDEEGELPAALQTVARLVDLGVLSTVEPWTARAGLAGAVHDVVEGFFAGQDELGDPTDPDEPPGRKNTGSEPGSTRA